MEMPTLYGARWVLPISSAAIEDGALAITGSQIRALGPRVALQEAFPGADLQDFGEAAILPGLVNAHSHLELTAMRGFLEDEEADFFRWLKKLTFARLERLTRDDIYVSALWGACEALRAGVTCVGDASDAAVESITALRDIGMRGTVFQESFGPDPKLAADNFSKLKEKAFTIAGTGNTTRQTGRFTARSVFCLRSPTAPDFGVCSDEQTTADDACSRIPR